MQNVDFDDVERKALARRDEAGLHAEDVVPDIVEVIERLGIPVAISPFGSEGPDGLYVQEGDDRLIVLNSGKYLPRFRFTGAHELGHATYEDHPHLDVDIHAGISHAEKRANAFAASFLLPRRALNLRCPTRSHIDPNFALNLAAEFGVSYPALIYRLHNVGLISGATRNGLLEAPAAVAMEKLRGHPGNEVRLPAEFVRRAQKAYEGYEITFLRFSELLRRDTEDLAAALQGSGILHVEDVSPRPS
jgi:Zn-dependent peptidase ImmA (M78 family)